MTIYALDELRAAVRELDAGSYTHRAPGRSVTAGLDQLDPAAVGVLGVGGGVGATVAALAIAETIGADRLIELCPAWASGLVEATTAELGEDQGWRLGLRGELLIERQGSSTAGVRDVPGRAVVDGGAWSGDVPTLLQHVGALVVVAPCTVPGLRRLENLMSVTATVGHTTGVLIGPGTVKAVPRAVTTAAGPRVRAAIQDRNLFVFPACSSLRCTGITGDPLPTPLLIAAATLTHHLKDVLP